MTLQLGRCETIQSLSILSQNLGLTSTQWFMILFDLSKVMFCLSLLAFRISCGLGLNMCYLKNRIPAES